MSFDTIANLIKGQQPFFLYSFRRNDEEFLFTNKKSQIVRSVSGITGDTWIPEAITHGNIIDTDQSFRAELPISFPMTNQFAFNQLGFFSVNPMKVRILKGFFNDETNELRAQFVGEVISVMTERNSGQITFSCMTDIAALERKGLSQVIQRPCRHALYGAGCGVNINNHKFTASVTSISPNSTFAEVDADPALENGVLRGGILIWQGRYSMIEDNEGNILKLKENLVDLVNAVSIESQSVEIAPGCRLTRADCNDKFENILNFGGFPWMSDNPFNGKQVF